MNYYYLTEGSEVAGPYSLSELTSLFTTGTLPRTTQACREGQQTWQPLASIIDTSSARPTETAIAAEIGQAQTTPSPVPATSSEAVTKPCPMCGEQILETAKKCKHCGEYLDASLRAAAKPTTEPSDALGIVIMLLPLASAALMWFWISSMNLLQNPSSTLAGIVIVTIIITSALMAVEASQLGMGGKRDGKATTGPAGWFLCGLLLWIVALPAYLYSRSKFGVKNYVVGGLVSALIFCGLAFGLSYTIEQQKSEVRRHFDQANEKLREEPSAPPAATPAAEAPDYQNFLRVARRLMTAIESGTSFQDFHERAVDVLASAKEASRSAPTPAKQEALATFATAITDAHDLWSCDGRGDYPGSLHYYKEPYGVVTTYTTCGRWDFELPTLVAAYKLDRNEHVGDTWYFAACSASITSQGGNVRIDFALKKIFKVCADTFEVLENPQ